VKKDDICLVDGVNTRGLVVTRRLPVLYLVVSTCTGTGSEGRGRKERQTDLAWWTHLHAGGRTSATWYRQCSMLPYVPLSVLVRYLLVRTVPTIPVDMR
jgi:hypothetical protein